MLKVADKRKLSLAIHHSSPPGGAAGNLAEQQSPVYDPTPERQPQVSVVSALVDQLAGLGVEQAFGVSGGAIALLFDAIVESDVELRHFRHETGAAFAAAEANFAGKKPTMVFATTGPGVLNAITGLTAARWDGAKVILVSGATTSPQRGRHATQETSSYTMPQDALYTKGPIFDFAVRMEQASELPQVIRRLSLGLSRPGGFVAHVCLPMGLQSKRLDPPDTERQLAMKTPAAAGEDVAYCAELLKGGKFAIWCGFGATAAAASVVELAERSGAKVFCSPRGKGIVPENHPLYLGVTGLGGHEAVADYIVHEQPDRILVLGTRLGEATSFWDQDLVPPEGFIHIDIDPDVPGTAYPDSPTLGIQAEIGHFLAALVEHFPTRSSRPLDERRAASRAIARRRPSEDPIPLPVCGHQPVRPQVLMSAIQRRIVRATDATVLAECGNSFAWCNHHLRFATAGRYRVSTLFGSMGHAAAGVVGAALARGGKAVAVVGDGSMLMNSELSTAAAYQAGAVWIVLNDGGYGMCRDGHRALGLTANGVDFQQVDFAVMARAVGAQGATVDTEDQLDAALNRAMAAEGPFVVDVRIDSTEASPLLERFESLIKQGNSKNVAGWEQE